MLELNEKLSAPADAQDSLTLPYESRQKSRQRVTLDSSREAAVVLRPGTILEHGDCLVSPDGVTVRIVAALEPLSMATCDDPVLLARACYHLGNRHVALQVAQGLVRYLPDHVLDDMVRGLGLAVSRVSAPFEPERGAYSGQPSNGARHAHSSHHHHHEHHHHDH